MAFIIPVMASLGSAAMGTTAAAAAAAGTTATMAAVGMGITSMGIGLVGSGISAYGQIQQGKAQRRQAEFQAKQYENEMQVAGYQGMLERQAADREQENVGRMRERALGQQVAAASASGLTITGSVQDTMFDSALAAERDIAMAKYRGEIGAWNQSNRASALAGTAAMTRIAGRNAQRSSKWAAGGTLMSGFASALGQGSNLYFATK